MSGDENLPIRAEVTGDTGHLRLDDPPHPDDLTAAVERIVEEALVTRGLQRLGAVVACDDREGMRALHRAGFRREGRLRQSRRRDGGRVDEYVYARLAEDEVGNRLAHTGMLDSLLPTKRVIAHVLVRDGAGRVLLCRTTYKPDWELPGGVVEPGESPRRGAVRECLEELGVCPDIPGTPVLVDWMPPWLGWSDAIEFIYDAGTMTPELIAGLSPDGREIADLHWVAPDRLPGHVTELSARRIRSILDDPTPRATENGFPL